MCATFSKFNEFSAVQSSSVQCRANSENML